MKNSAKIRHFYLKTKKIAVQNCALCNTLFYTAKNVGKCAVNSDFTLLYLITV